VRPERRGVGAEVWKVKRIFYLHFILLGVEIETRFQNLSLLPTCCLPGQRNETTNVVLGTSECRNTSVSSVNRKEGVLRRREGIGMCLD
jgi:hypothetical protein